MLQDRGRWCRTGSLAGSSSPEVALVLHLALCTRRALPVGNSPGLVVATSPGLDLGGLHACLTWKKEISKASVGTQQARSWG